MTASTLPVRAANDIPAIIRRRNLQANLPAACWLFACIILLALTFAAPINHDEEQYLGAASLTVHGRPFVDFLYLQTPLQPYLTWPLIAAFPGYGAISLRCWTAALGLLLLALVHAACRTCGSSPRVAATIVISLATTRTFLFSAVVVRNDLLPAVFAAAAIIFMIKGAGHQRPIWWQFAMAGVALGLATSTKISYLLLLGGAGAFLLRSCLDWNERPIWLRRLVGFSAGALVGLAPTILSWARAPEAFSYGVFEFAATAPDRWYRANGYGDRLGLVAKLSDSVEILALGSGLVILLIVGSDIIRRWHDPIARRERTLLDWLIIGGIIAAVLPTPTWRQYFLPLFIPLFVRLSLVKRPAGVKSHLLVALIAIGALIGPWPRIKTLARVADEEDWPLIQAHREAHWVGAMVESAGITGAIATLSPSAMIDSGLSLDRRFATGPFAYRTGDAIGDNRQRRLAIVSPRTLFQRLDEDPPAAIIGGHESGQNLDLNGLDRELERYAVARGYRFHASPSGQARLFVRPSIDVRPPSLK